MSYRKEFFKENLNTITHQIKNQAKQSICLIAVSKGQTIESIQTMIELGQYEFGENRFHEARLKINQIAHSQVRWNFIGRLQSNKIKEIVHHFHCIHSVDNQKYLDLIQKYSQEIQKRMSIYIQVNTSNEKHQGAIIYNDVFKLVDLALNYNNIHLNGLMTIAPQTQESELIRQSFRELQQLKIKIQQIYPQLQDLHLSMGMSNDYLIALQEGATHIRLGRILFSDMKSSKEIKT